MNFIIDNNSVSDTKTIPAPKTPVVFRRLPHAPKRCAEFVFLIGVFVLAGWAFDIDVLKRIVPGYVFMNPATAVAFILSSVALWLVQSASVIEVRVARVCAAVVLLTGAVKLCAVFGFFDVGIDQLLFRARLFDNLTGQPNRMAPNTAFNFLLSGAALLLFSVRWRNRNFFPGQYLGMFVLLSSFVAVVGYLYGAKSFYLVVSFIPMAIHTAVSFLLLAVGLLLSTPRHKAVSVVFSPHIGGQMARRLLPLLAVIPLTLGWLRLLGEKKGYFAAEMGTAMLVIAIIIIFVWIVIKNARLINSEAFELTQTRDALNSSAEILRLLGESEQNYRQLADAMPQMVWVANGSGTVDYFNHRWVEYTGLSTEELQSPANNTLIHPDDVPKYLDRWENSLRTGEDYKVEYRLERGSDGEYRWHLGQALPVRDEQNNIVKWFGTCTDIHEQKKTEEELRRIQEELESRVRARTEDIERANRELTAEINERKRTEETLIQLSSIVESSTDAIVSTDLNSNIISWNKAAERLHGYAAREVTGKSILLLFPPEREDEESRIMERIRRGETVEHYETVRIKKDGGLTEMSLTVSPIKNAAGEIVGASKIARDITERKRAEAALEEAAKRERAMIDNALDVICTVDGEGRFASINPACFKVWGYQPEELIGRKYIDLVAPEDVPKTNDAAASIMSGEPLTNFENRYRHKNGTLVSTMWTSYWSESERLMFAVAHDNTERKRAEEELKNFAARLERSNTELQDFASVASHDLQEPLRKVQAFGDRLKAKCGNQLDADGRDYLERMQNAAGRMQTLINDLLTFSRVTTQARPFVPVDLGTIANEVLSDLETRVETTGGTIEIGELATIDADPMQMRQLLQNLIGNALKFNRPGVPPMVKINGRVCRNFGADGDETAANATYCLTIEDNGIGFEQKYTDRIFKIFQRLHGRSEYEGTGIGLAVCRKIAERHGGDITARSVPSEGTTFTINLPIKHRGEFHSEQQQQQTLDDHLDRR